MNEDINMKCILSDENIIDLYWQREEQAISETHNKYGSFLYKIAYNILNDKLDSEECQNDTYLGIWNAIPPNKPKAFPAFISQIMRRVAINKYKENSRQKRIPSSLTISVDDLYKSLHSEVVENSYDSGEISRIINGYIRKLTKRQRYIFIEKYYMVETVENIAKELNVSSPTVYREINKMKCELKTQLEKNGVYI